MNEREFFLQALADNEDDTATRMIYSDWLDDQGEHEEADRQRKWPQAKEWMQKIIKRWPRFDLDYLLDEAGDATKNQDSYLCVWSESMRDYITENKEEFWRCWSILTRKPLPEKFVERVTYSCSC